ncbi:histidine phosphatase family protein [Pseudalkalibacillus salsuginis]|uniref:histidine phosphatase family protein n=1 Tax=Pseudalkalibacillus salsuginis TaxID=2910972 RepID=UPI001F25480E|nr:histidine phosphatase family protein [Pseudalkalibacillus salsuginis]MCF6409900.1 histidine phosphatase family protein [Pseudalkalibacillus salsuginis]
MQKLYIVRHCKAEGQPPEARLTEEGFNQAKELADFFTAIQIDRIISSPFTRAQQSIEPTARRKGLQIETDDRLAERILSTEHHEDWLEKLRHSFDYMKMRLQGGESNEEAMERAERLIIDLKERTEQNIILVTHGNLMTLLLKYFDDTYGFEEWKKLSNPDVFLVSFEDDAHEVERLWEK